MSLSYRTTFTFDFAAVSDGDWPESLPWPSWKPNTDRLMKPMSASVSIGWFDDDRMAIGTVHVSGPRINKAGVGLSDVHNDYYATADMPDFLRSFVDDAVFIVEQDMKQYRELDGLDD